MTGFWSKNIAAGSLLLAATVPAVPALAQQGDYERIVIIMRACAEIDDVMARVTCYDNNIGEGSRGNAAMSAPAAPSATRDTAADQTPNGFGADMVRQPAEVRRSGRQNAAAAQVAQVRELEPGIHLLTLSDGAQWQFVDSAPFGYEVPREGDDIDFERGALGSVFLEYADQRRLRVRRIR